MENTPKSKNSLKNSNGTNPNHTTNNGNFHGNKPPTKTSTIEDNMENFPSLVTILPDNKLKDIKQFSLIKNNIKHGKKLYNGEITINI